MKEYSDIVLEYDRFYEAYAHLKWIRDKYGLETQAAEDFIAISAKLELLDWILERRH